MAAMNAATLGFLVPAELAALVMAGAGLAIIVGLRRLGLTLLVAALISVSVAPVFAELLAVVPAPLRLVLFGLGIAMTLLAAIRFLLGRKVWDLVVAHVVSHAVIVVLGGLLRPTVARAVFLATVVAAALWLLAQAT